MEQEEPMKAKYTRDGEHSQSWKLDWLREPPAAVQDDGKTTAGPHGFVSTAQSPHPQHRSIFGICF